MRLRPPAALVLATPLAMPWACTGSSEPAAPSEEATTPAPTEPHQAGPSLDSPDALALTAAEPAKHVLLVLIDTLRADRQEQADTPVLDALARQGARVPRAWSAGTWTVPSVVSLFTGMSVRQHGYDESTGQLGRYPPLPQVPFLAEHLAAQGFATTGLYANPYLAEDLGFDRGFDDWRRSADKAMPRQVAELVEERWSTGERQFLYLHLLGPHSTLKPSAEARARHGLEDSWFEGGKGLGIGKAKRNQPPGAREVYSRAYDAVIEDTDARLGKILEALGPHRGDTLVLITSDHGELLGEHDLCGHGYWLWEPLTHVPLIVDHPHLEGAEESLPHTLGIASVPALLDLALGLEPGPWPTAADQSLPLVSQRQGKVALSPDGRFKGIWHSPNSSRVEVYDLRNDPAEAQPLASDQGLPAARAAWEAATPESARPADATVQLDAATREELEALGYVQDGDPASIQDDAEDGGGEDDAAADPAADPDEAD